MMITWRPQAGRQYTQLAFVAPVSYARFNASLGSGGAGPVGTDYSGVTKALYPGLSLPQYLGRDVSYHDVV